MEWKPVVAKNSPRNRCGPSVEWKHVCSDARLWLTPGLQWRLASVSVTSSSPWRCWRASWIMIKSIILTSMACIVKRVYFSKLDELRLNFLMSVWCILIMYVCMYWHGNRWFHRIVRCMNCPLIRDVLVFARTQRVPTATNNNLIVLNYWLWWVL